MKNFTLEKTMPLNLIGFNDAEGIIEFMRYSVTFSMATASPSGSEEDIRQAQLDQSTSFSKAITFIEAVLNNSLLITDEMSDESKYAVMVAYQNNVILLPGCSELYLIAALHQKLNSISAENTVVETLILKDIDNDMSYNYSLVDEEYDELPTDEEWLGEFSVWHTPWWSREDVCTMDKRVGTAEEYKEMMKGIDVEELNELNQAALREIEDSVMSVIEPDHEPNGELIEVDFSKDDLKSNWKPTLV